MPGVKKQLHLKKAISLATAKRWMKKNGILVDKKALRAIH